MIDTPGADARPPSPARLFNARTLISLAVAAAIVGVAVWRAPIKWGDAASRISHADLRLYLIGLFAFYCSFGIRGFRWQILLGNAGEDRRLVPLTGIVVTSFFVNCVLPAKMGDVYRAYLARSKLGIVASKAFGTIIAERLVDLLVLMGLLVTAGVVIFHRRVPGELVPYVIIGVGLCILGGCAVLVMRSGRGTRLLRLLPEAVFHRYESFRLGTIHALDRWPLVIFLTGLIWGLEASRLAFVVFALGYDQLGPASFLLIALVAALLTTVPFLPGGLGLVEAGMVLVLVAIGNVPSDTAASIALLDRSISYGSLVILGFVVFAVTHIHMPRHLQAAAPDQQSS